MSVDPTCTAFAQAWLAAGGWTYTGDIDTLAQAIQDTCEEFVAELEEKEETRC